MRHITGRLGRSQSRTGPQTGPSARDSDRDAGGRNVIVLQVVTLASASGKFGGPFDTSVRQGQIAAAYTERTTELLAGHLPGDLPTTWAPGLRYVGAEVHRWLPGPGFTGLMSWGYLRSAWRAVGRADLVHLSTSRELIPIVTMLICLVRRTPILAQTHGMMTSRTSLLHQLLDLVVRPLVRRSGAVIALTQVERRDLERWLSGRHPEIVVIGNPLLDPSSSGVRPDGGDGTALFVARLHPRKRVEDFVQAAAHAAAQGWPDRYVVIGPDEGDGATVTAAVARLPQLAYEGAVPASEVGPAVRRSSVFVLCSRDEPWGNVLVQALCAGVPVVVTRSAALAGEVEEFAAGLVVPDGDPAALAVAVHTILSDPARGRTLGQGGLNFAAAVMSEESQRKALFGLYQAAATW